MWRDVVRSGVQHWRRWLGIAGALFIVLWLAFFDSHSVARRVRWSREAAQLQAENDSLNRQIAELQVKLKDVRSADVVEEIAREQYGMRRPGETVYRVEPRAKP